MASILKVNTIQDATNSNTAITIDTSGKVAIGGTSVTSGFKAELDQGGNTYALNIVEGSNSIRVGANGPEISATGGRLDLRTTDSNEMRFYTNNSERMRIDSGGNIGINTTAPTGGTNNDNAGFVELRGANGLNMQRYQDTVSYINRSGNDGDVVGIQQGGSTEGTISVSGSTVSYNGFSGLHESSGIPTNTAVGTVVSTIDELDVYSSKFKGTNGIQDNPKAGKTRADHAKVKVSDTAGDKAVYGVIATFNEQGKVNVASVGIGSVRVTGACAKGDLLESNGDGTAKVQSDDIVRSKTIGKVTIGNSSTDVKLVSCVLYCG